MVIWATRHSGSDRYMLAFRFTSPEDHSYLTKAQEYWSELLDQAKFKEAEDFLFSLHWWSLPTQQDEVRDMVVDAVKFMLLAKRNAVVSSVK